MPFDARAAKLLQPGEHIILPEHPGLRLAASATRRAWIYRYKSPVDGGMRQVKLGEWPAMSYPNAAVEWEKRRADRDSGTDLSLQKKLARQLDQEAAVATRVGPYTVAQLVEDYLAGHIDKNRKPKGRAEVRRLLTQNTAPIADTPAALLLRSQAYDLLQGLVDRPVLAGQVRQEMGAAYDYGLDAGRLPENTPNWWRQIMRGKMPRSKGKMIQGERVGPAKRVLSEQEIGQLINWLPNFSKMVADALTMYLWTGTRGTEILQIQVPEVAQEPTGWWWTIPKHKTKNLRRDNATDLRVPLIGRAKTVVLRRLEQAQLALKEDPESPGYLFPSPNGKVGYVEQKTVSATVYAMQPYSKARYGKNPPRLTITYWSPHDLRRSVRTLLASMGCPGEVAESVLGHMLTGIVGVYNRHSYDAERLDWLTRLDAKLEELALQHAAS
jgi:integrase